jgi:FdhD protein
MLLLALPRRAVPRYLLAVSAAHPLRLVRRLGAGGHVVEAHDAIAEEAPLEIRARGAVVATILRTPGHDLELVRGFLHAEGKAGALVTAGPDAVDVDLDPAGFTPRAVASVAACGACGRERLDDLVAHARPVPGATDARVAAGWLLALPEVLRAQQPGFAATGGLHAAALVSMGGGLLVAREDVGRHNAVDKVIGWGLEHGVDFAACALMLSGRLGFELVLKAATAGVPVVAAVSAPSSLALDVAARFGVTAVAFAREGRASVYTHPARVATA